MKIEKSTASKILPGMSLENIERNSSRSFGLAANLFDHNHNGILEKDELNEFEKYDVYSKEIDKESKGLILESKNMLKEPKLVSIVYSDKDIWSLKNDLRVRDNLVYMHRIFNVVAEKFRVEYDCKKQSLWVQDAEKASIDGGSEVKKLDVSYSDVSDITARKADIRLYHVKNENDNKSTQLFMGDRNNQDLKVQGDTEVDIYERP